eukprot:COSAG06_NODE_304_length_17855_cov_47.399414_27_plen_40_part_00
MLYLKNTLGQPDPLSRSSMHLCKLATKRTVHGFVSICYG